MTTSAPSLQHRIRYFQAIVSGCVASALFALAACTTPPPPLTAGLPAEPQRLQPGDTIRISFPAAPNLDSEQQIRRDGMIGLQLVGEVKAADKTPLELQQELLGLYSPQLVVKEVLVTVVSAPFTVYVGGAVLRGGKLQPERVLTVLEAIMEAGGFDEARADKKKVQIIRHENGQNRTVVVDVDAILKGQQREPVFLRSNDVIYVPEKFNWF